jgi:hypothetical protein
LWQRRCEEYFQRWNTPECHLISYGSSQFTGAAVTWLEAFLTKFPKATWSEFVQAVQTRFLRNQHTVFLRRLYHIAQTGTMEDYVQRFSALVDAISAYETHPDPLHYLTRNLDGLKPAVRVLVAIQQPADLDAAFTMALLYEELGEGMDSIVSRPYSSSSSRRSSLQFSPVHHPPTQPPPPPAKWVSRTVEEKRQLDNNKNSTKDKWSSLRAYRKSKGLCFICGERWEKDHVCKNSIQLHVVREMLDCFEPQEIEHDTDSEEDRTTTSPTQLILLSAAANSSSVPSARSMIIRVEVQDMTLSFLIDSSSLILFHQSAGSRPSTRNSHVPIFHVGFGRRRQCSAIF